MRYIRMAWLGLILALMGCNPTLNWRSVVLESSSYQVWLPCKPDRGSRDLPLGTMQAPVQMVGCEVGGALFAVAWVDVPDGALREQAYTQWPRAMQANLRGADWEPQAQPRPAALTGLAQQAWGGQGMGPDGRTLQVSGLWWQHGSRIFHAAVYAEKLKPDMTEPFFSGIERQ